MVRAERTPDTGTSFERQGLETLRGIGPKLAQRFARLGMQTVFDLLLHLPSRHEDRTRVVAVAELVPGTAAVVEGEVRRSHILRTPRGRRLVCTLVDEAGDALQLVWMRFHAGQAAALTPGVRLRCFGTVSRYRAGMQIVHPEYRVNPTAPHDAAEPRLTPVYPATQELGQNTIRTAVARALEGSEDRLPDLLAGTGLEDGTGGGETLVQALEWLHRPAPDATPGTPLWRRRRERLAREELLAHHLAFRRARQGRERLEAPRIEGLGAREEQVRRALPFELTGAQARALAAIQTDIAGSCPMQRLLHGDVGCGKTVVAALAAIRAVDAGYQVALMAPTEVLAEQHLRTLEPWLTPVGVRTTILTGARPAAARRAAQAAAATGEADIVIGTHALFQQSVSFDRLGLVVVDEQHRFGVEQRAKLRRKGVSGEAAPHVLSMTATPIPRSLAMTFYADLDLSAIDELPPGRRPATTAVIPDSRREEVVQRVGEVCRDGAQAFWVCPAIEENEATGLRAAEDVAQELNHALSGLAIGLVHGRLPPRERDDVLRAFRAGKLDVLVATTVIEVGVDVPQATLMVVDNAERMGLAQLHQLRGRVGRGAERGYCVLMYSGSLSAAARARLDVLRNEHDGFRIAERDLELRGPGEFLGTRQAGVQRMRVADLSADRHLLHTVEDAARRLEQTRPSVCEALVARWLSLGFKERTHA